MTHLDQKGISHYIVPLLFVVIIGLVGYRVLSASHAATSTNNSVSVPSIPSQIKRPFPAIPANNSPAVAKPALSGHYEQCYPHQYGFCFYYVGLYTYDPGTGVNVDMSQPAPRLGGKDSHTLGEVAVFSADERSVIEFTWDVDWGLRVTSNGLFNVVVNPPHLTFDPVRNGQNICFISNWPKESAFNPGPDCGFVQVPSKYASNNGELTPGTAGKYTIQHKNSQWQIIYNDTLLGYYPDSFWNGQFTKYDHVEVWGEVASNSYTSPESGMGNGILGSDGGSAAFNNVTLTGTAFKPTLYPFTVGVPSSIYSYKPIVSNGTLTGINYGGPGYPRTTGAYVNLDPATGSPKVTVKAYLTSQTHFPPNPITSIVWDWGDGSKLTAIPFTSTTDYWQTGTHTYKQNGSYTVKLTSHTQDGSTTSASEPVAVY